MAEKNKFYRDFSNRKPFNNVPCTSEEELVPVVLSEDMRVTLKPAGLDWENVESWRFPYAKELVPVVFIPNKKGHMDECMKWFNSEVDIYLKHKANPDSDTLSLDAFLEGINDNDAEGFDPTGTTENEDAAFLSMTFQMLIDELSQQDENMGKIIKLLADGYPKNEIISMIDLAKGKTQAYSYLNKTQELARKLYNEKYR